MRRKGFGMLVLALAVMLAVVLQVYGAEKIAEMCVPMGIITLNSPEGVEAKKSPVEFPHTRHFATDCKVCHHTWQGEEKIKSCTASNCHDQIKAPQKSKSYLSYSDVSITYFKYAYHKMCIGCHREIKIQNLALEKSYQIEEEQISAAGPSGCVECHPNLE